MALDNVLITGSSKGLGYYLSKYFAEKGHHVLLHGRNIKNLKSIKNEFENLGLSSSYVSSDLRNPLEIKDLAKTAIDKDIKILVNNAGMTCPNIGFHEINLQLINNMIDINLKAPIILLNLLHKNINQVININSMVGIEPKRNRSLYASSKWGLKGFSDSLKKEELPYSVLDVYPTNIRTWPGRENSMEVEYVVSKIYNSMIGNENELILDGRKK